MRAPSVFLIPPDSVEYRPADFFVPLNLEDIFPGRADAPLEVDFGSGDGSFLIEKATREPERNFLGVERLAGRVRRTCRYTARRGLQNLRVFRVDSRYLVQYLLPAESVDVAHVLFPDPWPKRRHHPNRLIQTDFLNHLHRVLRPKGELRLCTDDTPYFQHMQKIFTPHPLFEATPWPFDETYPQTDFERQFRSQGLPIHRVVLKKIPFTPQEKA